MGVTYKTASMFAHFGRIPATWKVKGLSVWAPWAKFSLMWSSLPLLVIWGHGFWAKVALMCLNAVMRCYFQPLLALFILFSFCSLSYIHQIVVSLSVHRAPQPSSTVVHKLTAILVPSLVFKEVCTNLVFHSSYHWRISTSTCSPPQNIIHSAMVCRGAIL